MKLVSIKFGLPYCVISNVAANQNTRITETKFSVVVVALSTEDNAKLLQQLKVVFKCTINWNKYEPPNQYFDFLIEPSFQGVNRFFVLIFNANDSRIGHSRYFLPIAIIED